MLLYIASFQERKDHGTLLRAVAKVPDVDLILVGDGELRGRFERQAEELGIDAFLARLAQRLVAGLRLVQVREQGFSRETFAKFARDVLALARPFGARVIVNDVGGALTDSAAD